jgi:hypothetical protein
MLFRLPGGEVFVAGCGVNSFPFDKVLQFPTSALLLQNALRLPELSAGRHFVVARIAILESPLRA